MSDEPKIIHTADMYMNLILLCGKCGSEQLAEVLGEDGEAVLSYCLNCGQRYQQTRKDAQFDWAYGAAPPKHPNCRSYSKQDREYTTEDIPSDWGPSPLESVLRETDFAEAERKVAEVIFRTYGTDANSPRWGRMTREMKDDAIVKWEEYMRDEVIRAFGLDPADLEEDEKTEEAEEAEEAEEVLLDINEETERKMIDFFTKVFGIDPDDLKEE